MRWSGPSSGRGVSAATRQPATLHLAASLFVGGIEPERKSAKERAKEYRLKAALLFNFLKYAEYPESAFESKDSPFVVLIVGKDPFGSSLAKSLGKKKVGGRSIRIRRATTVPKDLEAHLVFTTGLAKKPEKELIKKAAKIHCVLVGEREGFAEDGGFINLLKVKGKVKLVINAGCQKSTGVTLKAELLKLAMRIVGDTDKKNGEAK